MEPQNKRAKPQISFWKELVSLSKQINWLVLLNVLLASIVIGVLVHEFFHLATYSDPVSICLESSEAGLRISACCLSAGEQSLELFCSMITGGIMLIWVMLNIKQIVKPPKKEKKPETA